MAIDSILSQIDSEIAKLTQVRSLLARTGKVAAKAIERSTKKSSAKSLVKSPAKVKFRKKRVLSPDARQRISDAQRKRWAAKRG